MSQAYREESGPGLVVDSFAGGGGASLGIELAIGRSPDIAINHDPEAIAMHAANHPNTKHFCESVWKVDPAEATRGQPVDLMWASPDCKHFSRAKGGKPVNTGIRGLAWVVVRWAKTVRPRVILLENVEEFTTWGPLGDDGRPCPRRQGETFRRWVGHLRRLGYQVETRVLRACDYGAPTSRRRLFLVARCDGAPIVWPAPTHGHARPYRTAAECINWDAPCPSIFERERPLAEATCRRIARGLVRYVIESAHPFIVGGAAHGLIQTGYGEREGQDPRALDIRRPLGTVVAGGAKHALVSAFLARHYSDRQGGWVGGSSLTLPMPTVTTRDHHSVVTANHEGARAPMVRAFLTKYYGTGDGQALDLPLGTVTTKDRFGLVLVDGVAHEIADIGMRMLTPRELARAQGFPDDYRLDVGGISKTAQVRMVGNSVCPPVAAALVRANVGEIARVAA